MDLLVYPRAELLEFGLVCRGYFADEILARERVYGLEWHLGCGWAVCVCVCVYTLYVIVTR